MRVAWEYEVPLTVSCTLYFGHIAEEVIRTCNTPRLLNEALDLGSKPAEFLKQFEHLKDPRSANSALWFAALLLKLAETAKESGIKTQEGIFASLSKKLPYSASKIKKLYLAAAKGRVPPLSLSDGDYRDAEYCLAMLRDWDLDRKLTD